MEVLKTEEGYQLLLSDDELILCSWTFFFFFPELRKFEMISELAGVITMEELAAVIHSLNERPTKEEVQEMINEVDGDGSGTIHFEDFLNIMATKMKVTNHSSFKKLWLML